jgi:hypothetical protein
MNVDHRRPKSFHSSHDQVNIGIVRYRFVCLFFNWKISNIIRHQWNHLEDKIYKSSIDVWTINGSFVCACAFACFFLPLPFSLSLSLTHSFSFEIAFQCLCSWCAWLVWLRMRLMSSNTNLTLDIVLDETLHDKMPVENHRAHRRRRRIIIRRKKEEQDDDEEEEND